MDEDDFKTLCFKHKIKVRREHKPSSNFKTDDYKGERERDEEIH